jgi:hypothetical protein
MAILLVVTDARCRARARSSPNAVAVAPARDSRREFRDKSLSSFAFPRKRPRRRNFLVSAV